jgi:hypothetical protein
VPAATLARYIVLEALRSGLPWLAAAALIVIVGMAAFLSQVAVTESIGLQASVGAALLRAAAVFLVAAHVASSTLRELNDKGLELMLALPIPRSTHYLGRLAGHAAAGTGLAIVFALPLLLWAPPAAVGVWTLSLAFEATVVAASALFFSMTLAQMVPAIAATAGLYLLGRSMTTIQAIAAGPLSEPSLGNSVARFTLDAIALFAPRLEDATRSEWLLYGVPPPGDFAVMLSGLALYAALLSAAGLFDFHRRNL